MPHFILVITFEAVSLIMENVFLEVFCEGLSLDEMNAVRGGAADPLCVCANGAIYDCGCYQECTCDGAGSKLTCSCNSLKPNKTLPDLPPKL